MWLLLGAKPGDNAQVQALAEALGWPCESKRLAYRRTELITNRLLGPNLAGIIPDRSSPLEPPWPELIISAGRRNEPVARWVQRQSEHRVRLVHFGRPWASLDCFDLIITTPQYRLPQRPNVLYSVAPLHRVTKERLAAAARAWLPRLAHLPRPWVAVLTGGHSGSFTFDPPAAACLGRHASAMVSDTGGALLLTTSARTPKASAEALEAAIDVPAHVFHWSATATDNPYYGYLALADALIVTADSVSMLTEACVTQRPVYIFDPQAAGGGDFELGSRPQWWRRARLQRLAQWLSMRLGPVRMRRDVRAIHRELIAQHRAVRLGETFPPGGQPPPMLDLIRAVERVRGLFEAHEAGI